jgi:hypothetical protein
LLASRLIAIDDLRPLFGRSYGVEEVLTPNLDKHFLDGNGSVMQNSYVQIAVCGPSRASILTGRRPDSTQVLGMTSWCWCRRTQCREDELFITLPTYLARNGYATSGTGKIFHPDACSAKESGPKNFTHAVGDDPRAWNTGAFGVEGLLREPYDPHAQQYSEEQWGSIPGPGYPDNNFTYGPSWAVSPLSDEEQTDGQLATDAIARLAGFKQRGIGVGGGRGGGGADATPFFLAVGYVRAFVRACTYEADCTRVCARTSSAKRSHATASAVGAPDGSAHTAHYVHRSVLVCLRMH